MLRSIQLLATLLLAPLATLSAAEAPQKSLPLPGHVFEVEGHTAFVILPSTGNTNHLVPWVWYAPTLPGLPGNEERWMFERFTRAGIAIAGIDVGESYGSPAGRALYSAFYEELTRRRRFAPKVMMLGRSRGGLMALSWAAGNPEKIAGFAGIYPVCNVASYPGVAKAAGAYRMSAEELSARLPEHNPIDRLAPLARAGVPLFAIHGDVDAVVPLEANSGLVQQRYTALGGSMRLSISPGQGHNMWPGFFQSEELVNFVKAHAGPNITLLLPLDHQRPVIGGLERHEKISPQLAGKVLISELGCAACHASANAGMTPKSGPDLSAAGARMSSGHMQRFIANPSATKPGTTMPDVLAHLPAADREGAALALAHYLASLAPQPMRFERPAADAIARGHSLYHSVGCVACHSPETALDGSVPLGPLEEKYSLASLTLFLEDPLAVRPDGRMPGSRLDHFEAGDLASYLLRRQTAAMKPFTPDAQLAARGKALFTQQRCDACHEVGGRRASPSLVVLEKLRPDKGCLGGTAGPWPRYPLLSEQRDAIKAALGESAKPIETNEQIELTLLRLNCLACHQRDDLGGVAANRSAFFTSHDENLGEQGRLPPPLTGVGAKLKREWLRDVVVNGASVRPYLRTRMPRFGDAGTDLLWDLLKQHDRLPVAEFERVGNADKPREVGRELAGSKGFNCIACHTFREKSAAPLRALDLTTMTARLEEDWFHHYLAAPQQFSPLTLMPNFWPDGKSPLPEVLDGNPGKQRDALWSYLAQGPEAGEPRGLVHEPLILAVQDEAVMLRRSYPGIGKRGIGVGYPSGINLSFDAGQLRLASIWTGGFIEASGVWRGQGAGNVQVLGKDTANFPAGPAFAVLESPATAWPTNLAKQAEGFQFKGYTLDAKQRPTFQYRFGDLTVEDRFLDRKETAGQPYFVRSLTCLSGTPPPGLHFRVAADSQIVLRDERDYAVGKTLWLRLPVAGIVREANGGRELLLPITITTPMTIEYHLTAKP